MHSKNCVFPHFLLFSIQLWALLHQYFIIGKVSVTISKVLPFDLRSSLGIRTAPRCFHFKCTTIFVSQIDALVDSSSSSSSSSASSSPMCMCVVLALFIFIAKAFSHKLMPRYCMQSR